MLNWSSRILFRVKCELGHLVSEEYKVSYEDKRPANVTNKERT